MYRKTYPDLVLAVALTTRGFAFVILEGPQAPLDWAIVRTTAQERFERTTTRIEKLIITFQPTALVLEDITSRPQRHSSKLRRLSLQLAHLGESLGLAVACFDRIAIRQCFAPLGARSKAEIAKAVALAIPALNHRLPPTRKLWMSEDERQLLFDAAALAMTFYVEMGGAETE